MTDPQDKDDKAKRRAEALRANLKRRKAATRKDKQSPAPQPTDKPAR